MFNRSLWIDSLTEVACPAWPCPVCRKGSLALIRDSMRHEETIRSIQAHDHDGWDADWIEYVFTAWAECRHPNCRQLFALAGTGGIGPGYDADGETEWNKYFSPTACCPMPDIIEIPAKCPEDVSQELRSAFQLFWSHRGACAGRIRVALECLMNDLGVPKRKKTNNGKFADLSLHGRIEIFAMKNRSAGPNLMALKWLGNAGSHDTTVSPSDLLDAFEVLEHSLGEIIDQRSKKVAMLARTLTKKHRGKR